MTLFALSGSTSGVQREYLCPAVSTTPQEVIIKQGDYHGFEADELEHLAEQEENAGTV